MHVGRGCDHRLRRGQLDRQGVRRRRPRGPLRRHRRRPGRGPSGRGLRGDDHRRPARPAVVRLPDPADPQPGHRYDLSAFVDGTRAVGRALAGASAFHTVVVRSTVPPGTCEQVVQPLLEQDSGKRVNEGFALASNPEFLRAATALEDFLFPWMTVIGARSRSTVDRLCGLTQSFGGEVRTFDNPAAAEMVKCCHNIFNAAKISFWNEMWLVCQRLGLAADDIATTVSRSAEASTNPDYGIRGGAPYGGACLPKDTKGV